MLLIAVVATGSVFAANTFSLGLVNYYQFQSIADGDTGAYVPSLRAEFFLGDSLGISGDALLLMSDPDNEAYLMMYIVDVIFRLPLGFIEPYIATG